MKKLTKILSVVITVAIIAMSVVALTACNNSRSYLYSGYAQTSRNGGTLALTTTVTTKAGKFDSINPVVQSSDKLSSAEKTEFDNSIQSALTEYKKTAIEDLLSWKVSYSSTGTSTGASSETSTGSSIADLAKTLLLDSVQNALTGGVDKFRTQLTNASITAPYYVDANAPIKVAEGEVAEENIDVVTGASGAGSDYYAGSGSYQTLEYALTRAGVKYYYSITWTKADKAQEGTTASTLEEAAKLPNAKYIREAFPNDGNNYSISMKGNSISTKTLVTKDAEGNITASVLGLGMTKIGEDYYITGSLETKKSLLNLLATDNAILVMYEYNPTTGDKSGAGARNFGCRLVLTLDRELSTFLFKGQSPVKISENKEMIEGAIGASLKLKVTAMWTLG